MEKQTAPSLNSFNYINNQTVVAPAPINDLPAPTNQSVIWTVPPISVSVLQLNLN